MSNEYKHRWAHARAQNARKHPQTTSRWLLTAALAGGFWLLPLVAAEAQQEALGPSTAPPAAATAETVDSGPRPTLIDTTSEEEGAPAGDAVPAPARPWQHPTYAVELGLGLPASQGPGAGAFQAKLALALGTASFHAGVAFEVVGWRSPLIRTAGAEWLLSLCPGLSAEWRFAHGRARTALTLGPAVLMDTGSSLGTGTAVGFFFEVRPLGVLFPLGGKTRLGLDPLGVRVLMPELSAIPVYDTQFHTSLWLEVTP